jgi:argininosuccinate lyase
MHIEARLIEKSATGEETPYGQEPQRQVAVDIRMFLKALSQIDKHLKELLVALLSKGRVRKTTLMPGYTHTQRAQVVTFGHPLWLRLHAQAGPAENEETYARVDSLPLKRCSGRLHHAHRQGISKGQAGFFKVSENSMDAVADRFLLDALYCFSMIMTHLSRFSEDLILFSTEEFGFIALPDGLCTGSSLMPHKKTRTHWNWSEERPRWVIS